MSVIQRERAMQRESRLQQTKTLPKFSRVGHKVTGTTHYYRGCGMNFWGAFVLRQLSLRIHFVFFMCLIV